MEQNKLWGVLTSRKAWAAILTILAALGIDYFKGLDPQILVIIIGAAGAMYMGSVALEDGLASLAGGIMALRAWWVGDTEVVKFDEDDEDDAWPAPNPIETYQRTK